MFTYNQTQKIQDTATAKGLELWARDYLYILSNGSLSTRDYGDDIPQLTLENLLPWLDKHFGGIENPEYKIAKFANRRQGLSEMEIGSNIAIASYSPKTLSDKLIQQATKEYYLDPQSLADSICEAINNHF